MSSTRLGRNSLQAHRIPKGRGILVAPKVLLISRASWVSEQPEAAGGAAAVPASPLPLPKQQVGVPGTNRSIAPSHTAHSLGTGTQGGASCSP